MSEKLLRICQESLFSGEYSTYGIDDKMQNKHPPLMKESNTYDLKAREFRQ